ncbi:hypothetical protein E2C01_047716 [Portunus trituberculatus]|uniref:Uncharacterized protein n=1 Tax=Portunus trituberculatus TaxID=210409 RepID=A0A5B7G8N0_PORTR|nr:hypothetical protein [Portunus trituberculatus]
MDKKQHPPLTRMSITKPPHALLYRVEVKHSPSHLYPAASANLPCSSHHSPSPRITPSTLVFSPAWVIVPLIAILFRNLRGLKIALPFFLSTCRTMTRFHIHSVYYFVILYSFRHSCGEIKIVKIVAINLLTSIDPDVNKVV